MGAQHARDTTVLVDMDEVIAYYLEGLDRALVAADPDYPLVPHEERTGYAHLGGPGFNPESLAAGMNTPGLFRNLRPVEGAVEVLREMAGEGLNVLVVTTPTYGNPTCVQDKYEWMDRHVGPEWVNRTIIAYDKTVVSGAVLIDDKPSITGSMEPSWKHLLFTRPYNRYVESVPRIEKWEDWKQTVLPLIEPSYA
ncbi:5' nucleotidase, NT5C type [Arthrobacter caoxuetaonis]|uniref:Uncharacterized protein n=1 Tax=Arthrobacter caoxuetaonis TaxID=2886935 RepID=A0A9X1MFT2_9MICC|nr:hypothetical protein [Arthrobacter caoxuetaonis]MCC3299328.1 hypothetical protein [Arthrobacter caoxuetaonis]USQ59179.1 hypothetical protein NF551_18910 [Arthrobacter caoxuetaonis]